MAQEKTLNQLTAEVIKSFAGYDQQGTKHWTWETAARDLPYQVGSLLKVMLQLSGERYAEGRNRAELDWQLRNELADIMAEVLYIAHELEIDMNQALVEMMADDRAKQSKRAS